MDSRRYGAIRELLVFDTDKLWLSLFGWNLIREAYKKISKQRLQVLKMKKEDLRVKGTPEEWINRVSSLVLNWFVEKEIDEYISSDPIKVGEIMQELQYKEYHKYICFSECKNEEFREYLKCGLCGECEQCQQIFKDYLSQYKVMKKTIIFDERIDLTKINEWDLVCIPNLLSDDFIIDNVVNEVYIGNNPNEVIIEYLDDYSGYFSKLRNECIKETMNAIENILSIVENS